MNRYFSHDEKVKLTRIMLLGGLLEETIKEYAGLQNTDMSAAAVSHEIQLRASESESRRMLSI